MAPPSLQQINEAPHATAERFEQMPRNSRTRLIAVVEMGQSSWLVAGIVPGVERQPLKKLAVDESALLKLLDRWREEAEKAGHRIVRIAIAFEAGRDGFWLARWLGARDIEAHVIHASSVAVSREHRRASFTHAQKKAPQTCKTMIAALARKPLIDLWRLMREGTIPEGVVLHPAL
jgi:hypothetical protein